MSIKVLRDEGNFKKKFKVRRATRFILVYVIMFFRVNLKSFSLVPTIATGRSQKSDQNNSQKKLC